MFRSDEIDLKYYGMVISRWKRLILTVAAACVGLTLVLNLVMQPIFQAVTRIEISKEPTRSPITGELISDDFQSDNVALYTAAELMTNRGLMREVVHTLRERQLLQMNAPRAEFFQRLRERFPFKTDRASATDMVDDANRTNREVDWLLSVLTITPIRETRLVKVSVEHWNPRIAKAIADVVAADFVEYQSEMRAVADTARLGRLRSRIQDQRGEISALQEHLSNEAGMPVLEERVKQLSGTISGLNEALVKAHTDRLAVEAQLQSIRRIMSDTTAVAGELPIHTDALDGMWKDLLQRQTELARAREVFKEHHPRVLMLETELKAIRANIGAELQKNTASLNSQHAVLEAQERSLRSAIAGNEGQLRSTSGMIGQQSTLEGQLRTQQEFYNLLNAKVQEGEISGAAARLPLVRVVEPATVGADPIRPRKVLNLILGLVVGLFAGTGLALFLEYLRRAIRTPNDVMEHLQLPVLGMIPKRPQ